MVSSGLGLNILINSDYSAASDWMCFSLCYSIKKVLPEALFAIKFRNIVTEVQRFVWLNAFITKPPSSYNLIIDPNVVIIRPISMELQEKIINNLLSDDELLSEAKEDKFTPFVSYKQGCARFVMSDWINSNEYPFPHADRLANKGMCPNELQVLRMWKQMNTLYALLARG